MASLRMLVASLITGLLTLPAVAQDAPLLAEENSPPIAVLTFSSIDRTFANLSYLVGSIGQPELLQSVDSFLKQNGNLGGVDRSKPIGWLVFLKPAVIPQPAIVSFAPITDPADWTKGASVNGMTVKKVADDRYELVKEGFTMFARIASGYVFTCDDELLLDRKLPDPAAEFAGLATRYSLAIDIRPQSIPNGQRELFRNLLRQKTQADLQRRDEESELDHRLRKAQGLNLLKYAEFALNDLRSVTVGVDLSEQTKKAVVELLIDVTPGSAAAEALHSITGQPTHFAAVIDDSAIASLNLSLPISPENQELWLAVVDQMQKSMVCDLCDIPEEAADYQLDADPILLATVKQVCDPLRNTISQGHFDLLFQVYYSEEKKFSVIIGISVIDAAGMASAGRELIDRTFSEEASNDADLRLQLDAIDADGVKVHRVFAAMDSDDEEAQRLVGGEVSVCFGFGNNSVWLGQGGPDTGLRMAEMITRGKDAGPAERGRIAPIRLTLHASRWLNFSADEADFLESARQSFTSENDTLTLDLRPTKTGARVRLVADEGYVKLFAWTLPQTSSWLFKPSGVSERAELGFDPLPGKP